MKKLYLILLLFSIYIKSILSENILKTNPKSESETIQQNSNSQTQTTNQKSNDPKTNTNKNNNHNHTHHHHNHNDNHNHHDCVHTIKQEQATKHMREMDEQAQNSNQKSKRRILKEFKSPLTNEEEAEPIRITIDYSEIDNAPSDQISSEKKQFIKNQLYVAKAFYEKRLKIIRVKGANYFEYQQCGENYIVPEDKRTIYNSDLHIYATAAYERAWAIFCQQEDYGAGLKGRPTFARVHYNAYFIQQTDSPSFAASLETTIHEIAHALVFSPGIMGLFPHFRNEQGQYHNGYTYGAFTYSSKNVILEDQDIRGYKTNLIVTPNVKKWAKNHYNCSQITRSITGPLAGLQLENQGTEGSRGSHWERTILYDEIMTASRLGPTKTFSGATFALFKDSGWYSVNDDEEEKLQWGYQKGCGFLDYKCDTPISLYDEFCNEDGATQCSGGREGKGRCVKDPEKLEIFFMDSPCGIVSPYANAQCIDPHDQKYDNAYSVSGQTMKSMEKAPLDYDSRCFESTYFGQGAQCYRYECTIDQKIIIKFREETGEYQPSQDAECIFGGQEIINHGRFKGTLTCPDPVRFCKQRRRFCPNWCNSRGYCSNGVCICFWGYGGEDCSVRGLDLPTCGDGFEYYSGNKVLVKDSETECQDTKDCCPEGQNCDVFVNVFNRKCQKCDESCKTCRFGGDDKCVTCSSAPQQLYLLENITGIQLGQCVVTCPDGFWGDSSENYCKQCTNPGNPCQTCKEKDYCTTCKNTDYLDIEDPTPGVDNYKGVCKHVSQCIGTFKDNHSKRCFKACPPTRVPQGNECTTCEEGKFMNIKESPSICIEASQCPNGTYPNILERVCFQCHNNCKTCFTGTQNGCLSCHENKDLFFFGNKCIPKESCPEGSFADPKTWKCNSCDPKCLVCESEGRYQCQKCSSGYFFDQESKMCGTDCPPQTFKNRVLNQCTKCHSSCKSCKKETESSCSSCFPGYVLLPGAVSKCVNEALIGCPQYYYNSNSICSQCHQNCLTCTGNGPDKCIHCKTGYYKYTNDRGISVCLFKCPNLFYGVKKSYFITEQEDNKIHTREKYEQICEKCHPSCMRCKGPGEKDCLQCNQWMFYHNGECVRDCPVKMDINFNFRECAAKINHFQFLYIVFIIILFILE